MRKLLFALLLLWPGLSDAQTQTCMPTPAALQIVSPNTAVLARQPQFSATFNGAPLITESELGIFPRGADPLTTVTVSGVVAPRTSWTLVTGTTDCYRIPAPILFGVTPNVEYDLRIRNRTAPTAMPSGWSTPALPFGRSGPPDAPTQVNTTP